MGYDLIGVVLPEGGGLAVFLGPKCDNIAPLARSGRSAEFCWTERYTCQSRIQLDPALHRPTLASLLHCPPIMSRWEQHPGERNSAADPQHRVRVDRILVQNYSTTRSKSLNHERMPFLRQDRIKHAAVLSSQRLVQLNPHHSGKNGSSDRSPR